MADDDHGSRTPTNKREYDPRTDPIFGFDEEPPSSDSEIFRDSDLLEIDRVPTADRIVGRDDDIKGLGKNLRKLIEGDQEKHALIWGETGTGKTLVSRHVCQRLEKSAAAYGNPVVSTYLNCDMNSTFTSTFRNIATRVNNKAENPIDVPFSGLSAEQYRMKKLWPIVEAEFESGLIVILDELDKHPDIWEVLYTLTRTRSKDGVDVPVVVIGISNDINFKKDVEARVESTLQPEHYVFNPYTKDQLAQIMENRIDAFHDGILEDGVIPRAAELAAKEHGDARKAVRLLYNAGEYAEETGSPTVMVEHVEEVNEKVEIELFQDIIEGTSLDSKLLLFTMARLEQYDPDSGGFRTSEIHRRYQDLCRDIQEDPKGHNRVLQLLNKQALTGTIESRNVATGNAGSYRSHRLMTDPEMVYQALVQSTPQLAELMNESID